MSGKKRFSPGSRMLLGAALWLGVAFSVVAPSYGYELMDREWRNNRARFAVNPNFPSLAGSPTRQIEIFRCAAATWRSQSRANFEFEYSGTTSMAEANPDDNVNAVYYSAEDGNDALASTFVWSIGNRLVAFDMVFFGSSEGTTNNWLGEGEPISGQLDLWGTAVHEFGHALGLRHSSDTGATMWESIKGRGLPLRLLYDDDMAGVEAIYGQRSSFFLGPRIDLVTPSSGPFQGGNPVIIEGINFSWPADTRLFLGGVRLSSSQIVVESCSRIVIPSLPSGSGTVDLSITNSRGSDTLDPAYEYRSFPEVAFIEPDVGPTTGGVRIEIHGSNFSPDSRAFLGGLLLESVEVVNSGLITGVIPASNFVGPVNVEVDVNNENAILPLGFTYHDDFLRFDDVVLPEGTEAPGLPVDLLLTNTTPLTALSTAFLYDPSEVQVLGVLAEAPAAEVQDVEIDEAAGVATFQVALESGEEFPAGVDQPIAQVLFEAVGSVGTLAALQFPLDDPALATTWTSQGSERFLLGLDGQIEIIRSGPFVRGDATVDSVVTIGDPILLLFYLFKGASLSCADAADANDDGALDFGDVMRLLDYLFLGGETLAAPLLSPGVDPTPDQLGCDV